MSFALTLQKIEPVTHDTWHLVFARPEGFSFEPGQATHITLDRPHLRDQDRPFTMISQPDDETVESVIKSYPEHDGVTQYIPALMPGDAVTATDPEGAITDHGPGIFIAAGAGITPFIPILRRHARQDAPGASRLLYANKTEGDIILRDEWEDMKSLDTVFIVSDQTETDLPKGRIDKPFLQEVLTQTKGPFYLCGPEGFVTDVRSALKEIGVAQEDIVTEAGW